MELLGRLLLTWSMGDLSRLPLRGNIAASATGRSRNKAGVVSAYHLCLTIDIIFVILKHVM